MVDVALLPNDCDKEVYRKICEAASSQNLPAPTLQREILCSIFNIPSHYSAETKNLLLHKVITEKSLEENTRIKQCIRNCFRKYFGLPVAQNRKYDYEPKKRTPLKQGEKRFQILSFLVTVNAATKTDIDRKIGMNARDTLRANLHYFEQFQIPYDKHFWWRTTEQGRQDYLAIVGQIETVVESKLESQKLTLQKLREGDIQERIVQEEQEKKIRESKIQVRKIREQKRLEREQKRLEKAEKIRQLEQKKAERRKIREQERLEKEKIREQKKAERRKIREECKRLREQNRKEIPRKERPLKPARQQATTKVKKEVKKATTKVKKEVKKATTKVKKEVPMTETRRKYLMRQEQKAAREAEREAIRQKEAKMEESFKEERTLRAGKRGIEHYFLYDMTNPVDVDIVRRIQELSRHGIARQERCCKQILTKRLGKNFLGRIVDDQVIEQVLLHKCLKNGKTRNEYVRELFCIHFNIKEGLERVVQTHNPALFSAQGIAGL